MTSRIGLIGTISTQFTEPYNVARYLASLTHLSGTPDDIADGFTLLGGSSLDRFADEVLPRLAARGLFSARPALRRSAGGGRRPERVKI